MVSMKKRAVLRPSMRITQGELYLLQAHLNEAIDLLAAIGGRLVVAQARPKIPMRSLK